MLKSSIFVCFFFLRIIPLTPALCCCGRIFKIRVAQSFVFQLIINQGVIYLLGCLYPEKFILIYIPGMWFLSERSYFSYGSIIY